MNATAAVLTNMTEVSDWLIRVDVLLKMGRKGVVESPNALNFSLCALVYCKLGVEEALGSQRGRVETDHFASVDYFLFVDASLLEPADHCLCDLGVGTHMFFQLISAEILAVAVMVWR